MQKEENEVLEEIEIIDDFDDEIPAESQKKQNDIEEKKDSSATPIEERKIESAPAMTQLQEELRRETLATHKEEAHIAQPQPLKPMVDKQEEVKIKEENIAPMEETSKEDVKANLSEQPVVAEAPEKVSESEPKIDEELIHSSLENTMLLNKELLKAAAAETVKETKDESKENKKGIIFVIIIFGCLIIFTALIPFILKMFE